MIFRPSHVSTRFHVKSPIEFDSEIHLVLGVMVSEFMVYGEGCNSGTMPPPRKWSRVSSSA
jgi:hypothetical protein